MTGVTINALSDNFRAGRIVWASLKSTNHPSSFCNLSRIRDETASVPAFLWRAQLFFDISVEICGLFWCQVEQIVPVFGLTTRVLKAGWVLVGKTIPTVVFVNDMWSPWQIVNVVVHNNFKDHNFPNAIRASSKHEFDIFEGRWGSCLNTVEKAGRNKILKKKR